MRLTNQQISSLIDATHICFGNNAEVWLFGSRVDDTKKGGDIDLYIETDLEKDTVAAKLHMRKLIGPVFGEQKIDIVVRSRSKIPSPIHEIAMSTGQKLAA
ncbi:MAG: nucleotidyltransferase domain-containing protein [Chlamydiales bacterium]|nr:nucleotidyltransferase domain-containing protein [Chlamydiales bacterium]